MHPLLPHYAPLTRPQALALALAPYDHRQDTSLVDLMTLREQLTQALHTLPDAQRSLYLSQQAGLQLQQCLVALGCGQGEPEGGEAGQVRCLLEGLQGQAEALLGKIGAFRQARERVERARRAAGRVNALLHKKYNMQNYLEQLQLVRGMVRRIAGKLAEGSYDFRFLEEILGKELIPYAFYQHYCLNVACKVIASKLQQQSLLVLKHGSALPHLFARMQTFFFTHDLYEDCQQFLRLAKAMRLIDQQNRSIEDGFPHLFKPYFLQVLQQAERVDSTSFLKARSLMQFNLFTVELWREYEDYQVEQYALWSFEQFNLVRKSELLHLARLKEAITHFQRNYQWIATVALRNVCTNDFPSELLRAAVVKVLSPFLTRLYEASEKKGKEKHKNDFHSYWIYSIFGKHQQLYRFLSPSLKEYFSCRQGSEEGELNQDQYFKYYQQMQELLSTFISREIGSEFKALWAECWVKVCSLDQPIEQVRQQNSQLLEEIDYVYYIKGLEGKLEELLKGKKGWKKEERLDEVYGTVVNLNLNSSKYFLLREAMKHLDKAVEKQVNSIREIAYKQLAG